MARRGGIRLEGVDDLTAGLSYTSKEITAGAAEALKTGADMLRQRARDYAPFDEGDLERSVKIIGKNLSQRAAKANELWVEVGVDGSVEKRSREGVFVEDYAGRMESGEYNLGDKSEDKNEEMKSLYARDLKGRDAVGPGFFSRAVRDGEPYIRKVIAAKIASALRKANSRRSNTKGARK